MNYHNLLCMHYKFMHKVEYDNPPKNIHLYSIIIYIYRVSHCVCQHLPGYFSFCYYSNRKKMTNIICFIEKLN